MRPTPVATHTSADVASFYVVSCIDYELLGQIERGPRLAECTEPEDGCRVAAYGLALSFTRLVSAIPICSDASPRLSALAHVHRLWR
jgi:hypothetical protein